MSLELAKAGKLAVHAIKQAGEIGKEHSTEHIVLTPALSVEAGSPSTS
jgi:hypothetical protein